MKYAADNLEYIPFDGDFDNARAHELGKFATDLLGKAFIGYKELCLSFSDGVLPEWVKGPPDKPTINVLASNNEGDKWIEDKSYPIPSGWTIEQVKELFQYGNIYFQPTTQLCSFGVSPN